MSDHFTDGKVFRTGNGSEVFEISAPNRGSQNFGLGMDSWDAPEIGMRLSRDSAKALADWLVSRLSELENAEESR